MKEQNSTSQSFVYNMNMWHPKWLHSHCERKLREALGLDRMFKNHTGKIQTAYNRKERTHKMLQRYAGVHTYNVTATGSM